MKLNNEEKELYMIFTTSYLLGLFIGDLVNMFYITPKLILLNTILFIISSQIAFLLGILIYRKFYDR